MENNLIGRNIFKLRKINGITQQELASNINYSDKVISKWERGESLPDINALTSMASFFDVDIEFFITEQKDNKAETNDLIEKENRSHNFHKPLIFLHIFFILLTISFLAKALAIIDDLAYGPEWSYGSAVLISMAITVISIIDVFLVHMKVNRLSIIVAFFTVSVIATLVLISAYISYGIIVDEAITKTIYYQVFSCIASFVVGYCIEYTAKRKPAEAVTNQQDKVENKRIFSEKKAILVADKQTEKTNNTLHLSMIIISIFVIIFLALPFYNITVTFFNSYDDNNNNNNELESIYEALQEEFGEDIIIYDSEFNPIINNNNNNNLNIETEKPSTTKISFYQALKNNAMFIIIILLLFIIVLWDIINYMFKKGQEPRELVDKKTSGGITLISSVVFFVLFFISQIVLLKRSDVTEIGNMIMVMAIKFMWGFFICLTTLISWLIIRITLALKLIKTN